MTVSLTPAEADAKIKQIEDAKAQAIQKLNHISDAQEQMLHANWHGGSATTYQQTSQGQREEFDDLIKTLDDIVQKGEAHIHAITHADNA